ncbi:MAG: hypothetical protein WCH21_11000, partial [Bacteroidota bacterium]
MKYLQRYTGNDLLISVEREFADKVPFKKDCVVKHFSISSLLIHNVSKLSFDVLNVVFELSLFV